MIRTLAIAGYRSLRDLVVPLGRLNLIRGPNASGKSNLYRALRLLSETAQGGVVASLAREGGLASTLWAGPETISRAMRSREVPVQGGPRQGRVSLRLGFAGDELSYAIEGRSGTPSCWEPAGPGPADSKATGSDGPQRAGDVSGWTPRYTGSGTDANDQPLCFGPMYIPARGGVGAAGRRRKEASRKPAPKGRRHVAWGASPRWGTQKNPKAPQGRRQITLQGKSRRPFLHTFSALDSLDSEGLPCSLCGPSP